jgi:hypothetical protein
VNHRFTCKSSNAMMAVFSPGPTNSSADFAVSLEALGITGAETAPFAPFHTKMDHLTKTGLGQTHEKLRNNALNFVQARKARVFEIFGTGRTVRTSSARVAAYT